MTAEAEATTATGPEATPANQPVLIPRRAECIGEDDTHQASDALLVNGDRPTVGRVRAQLGRGSPNTIALFLDRWW